MWFHAFSNNKQKASWLQENNRESTHEYIDRWITVQKSLTYEFCKLYPRAFKALGRQKPTLRSYVNQCEEAKAREAMEAYFSNGLGPPMHDGVSVLKHGLESPETVAEKLSEVVTAALGYKMSVHHEEMESVQLQNMCSFSRKDIVSNYQSYYKSKEEFDATLTALAHQLSRYFVCMTKMETDAVVELEYAPGGDRISKHIIRTSAKTTQTHPGMIIVTQVERTEATDIEGKPILDRAGKPTFVYTPKKYESLLAWYIRDERRREKHRISVYFTAAEARKHPNDLNVFGGLPFDERFENDELEQERRAFVDPFDEEPDWTALEGLDFLMWHMKYNLHDGDSVAFAYTTQLLGFSIQFRTKSGVLILFTGVQSTGKTAIFGQNESGPGVYMRIYGDCGMVYSNIETLLKDFNADAMGKLYCLLEEANPGSNNTRNNNQLKGVITDGRQRIERKGIGAFHVDDCRSFVSCSQDVPFKIEQGDRRFVVNRTRTKFSPTGVSNGEVSQEEFVELARKLDRPRQKRRRNRLRAFRNGDAIRSLWL